jgi:DnaJ like chaperone protein
VKFLGRIIGTLAGMSYGKLPGALLGFWLGWMFDKKINPANTQSSSQADKQRLFFITTFQVMGHVAKADGVVSRDEIRHAEQVMNELGLRAEQREKAKEYFRQGKESDFDFEQALQNFSFAVGKRSSLAMMFLEIQISSALADGGSINPEERQVLLKVCGHMGVPEMMFDQLVSMIMAGRKFKYQSGHSGGRQQSSQHSSGAPGLSEAYAILGVSSSDSDAVIKRAYRKLLSQHHPDKLQAKGLPEEMIKLAAQKTHEIRQAYEVIKKSRGF